MRYIIELEGDYQDIYVWRTYPQIKFICGEQYALTMEMPQAMAISIRLSKIGLHHHLRPHRDIPKELLKVCQINMPRKNI